MATGVPADSAARGATYRILSLDGGGLRGLLTATLLEQICEQMPNVFDDIDLIAGNSSGALLALALADSLGQKSILNTLRKTRALFENGKDVLGSRRPWWLFPRIFHARYGSETRERNVKDLLGENKTLGDLKRRVLITAFDLDNESLTSRTWKPKLFHNYPGAGSDRAERAWEVALYSSAAPSLFPSVNGFVDGGVYANNPSMCALAQIYDNRYDPNPKPALKDVVMFSVGAGQNLKFESGKEHDWGAWQWLFRVVPLLTDGVAGIADYEVQQILGDANYRRLAPNFPQGVFVDLDDLSKIDCMKKFAASASVSTQVNGAMEWLQTYWMPGAHARAKARAMIAAPGIPRLLEATSKHVETATELTCLIPIKPGFVDLLDTRTYATRLRILFKVLHSLRVASREVRAIRTVVDTVDAIRSIHSFTVTIIAERLVFLSVTFDRPWEPYMRIIWRELGPIIDVILCNCDGYLPRHGSEKGFDRFASFLRQHQIEPGFFYPSSSLSVDDDLYLSGLEELVRGGGSDRKAASLTLVDPVAATAAAAQQDPVEAERQWFAVLHVLFGLRNLFPEDVDRSDEVLLKAASSLLTRSRPQTFSPENMIKFREPLQWLIGPATVPAVIIRPEPQDDQIQGGIVTPYRGIGVGCLLLAQVEDPAKARRFLEGTLLPRVTTEGGEPIDDCYLNVAFTSNGLRRLGMLESALRVFPKEFREGMDARAGMLGDVRENHPERWTLPPWNLNAPSHGPIPPVRMSTVDIVLTLRKTKRSGTASEWNHRHPLFDDVERLSAKARDGGIRFVSVQPMYALRRDGNGKSRDHFGFIDGVSQPVRGRTTPAPTRWDDRVDLGELLVGHRNQRGDQAFSEADDPHRRPGTFIDNGSFLVVRKMRQHVRALYRALDAAASATSLTRHELMAKMMGRTLEGEPIVPTAGGNDFNYNGDADGRQCPFHAHIRRANPRTSRPVVPRLARRGMAYGKSYDEQRPDDTDRGLLFMAYNASIAEQFEVIQRWMTGGNSTGSFSGVRDPFVGVAEAAERRTFQFVNNGEVIRADLGDAPFVTLDWGLYLFVPSIIGLRLLAKDPQKGDGLMARARIEEGNRIIEQLQTADHWSSALEDITAQVSGATGAVCAAIRDGHKGDPRRGPGAIRTGTKYGTLVAEHGLAMEVLRDDSRFSVREYQPRMQSSIGQIFLALDDGDEYRRQSKGPNEAMMALREADVFDHTFDIARQALEKAIPVDSPATPLLLDRVVDKIVAFVSKKLVGVPDGHFFKEGEKPFTDSTEVLHCPHHTIAPSRYVFSSPLPRARVKAMGEGHGSALLARMVEFVTSIRPLVNDARDSAQGLANFPPLLAALVVPESSDDEIARNLVGVLEGMHPTVYGNALQVLGQWLGDETLWRVQQAYLANRSETPYLRAQRAIRGPLMAAMQARPVPDLIYRTTVAPTVIGSVAVPKNETVVIAVTGVTEQRREAGVPDVMPIFGGDRRAEPHPTHACPGYEIGMGMVLGMMAALMEGGVYVPTPALLTVIARRALQPRADASEERVN